MIFSTIKLMITTNSKIASENIVQLLILLKHHQQLEIHRLQSMKAEIFKVKIFQIILPFVIALITGIFFFTTSTFPHSFYPTSISPARWIIILFCGNQILSVNISIYFFRRTVRLRNSVFTIFAVTSIWMMTVFISYIVFHSISFSL
jgi:hypothetical protein